MQYKLAELQNRWRLGRITRQVAKLAKPNEQKAPVVFFNASTRIISTSLNAGFSSLAAWGLRLAGLRVKHFVCHAGMSRCVLETRYDAPHQPPACHLCIAQSQRLYSGGELAWFKYHEDETLSSAIDSLALDQLTQLEYKGLPLGKLVLPSFRWALRRQFLPDTENTRYLLKQFLLSANNIAVAFKKLLEEERPSVVVVFNGQMYPEAVVRHLAIQHQVPVVTHEVSFQPLAGFFSFGEATAFPIAIPEDFSMGATEDKQLDEYLEKRFKGNFSMAGIQFWPEMRSLGKPLLDKMAHFKQVVPIFTNVVFDTSQPHANTVFEHMFAWLDSILVSIQEHPETLFVIRAHPDELREGKQSVDSVRKWVAENNLAELPNVIFIDAQEYVSSYDLIEKAKFVAVYNSSIALEASLLKAVVLCGGKSRFTEYETMYFPSTVNEYRQKFEEFLQAETLEPPSHHYENARRFLYYQNWHTPLPFADFLEEHSIKGYVRFKRFDVRELHPDRCNANRRIAEALFSTGDFSKS